MTNTTNTERLKPCPFCGAGNTEIRQNGRTWTGMKFSDPVSVSVRHWCAEVHGQPTRMIERAGRDEESAIAAWNTSAALAEAEGQAVPQSNLDLAAAAVAAFRHRLSYNYSYTGEPAGLLKTLVADLDRALSNRPMLAAAPEAPAAPVVEPVAYVELTDAECDEFRRHQGDFNSMLRATHRAGYLLGSAHPPAPREPLTVDAAIGLLVDALAASKGWLRGYADATIRHALDYRGAPREPLTKPRHSCEWSEYGGDETGAWHTGCGQSFVFMDGGPKENSAEWCQYCGGRLSIGTDREGG